jgi:hypothetical protein
MGSVEKAAPTKSGNYVGIPLQLNAIGGGSRNPFHTFYYRPEWLTPTFRVSEFDKPEYEGTGFAFMHGKNIGKNGKLGTLQAFAGSYEGFVELAESIFALGDDVNEPAKVYEVMAAFNEKYPERVIGYTLKQKQTKTDEVDPETGKARYIKEDGYDVNGFFIPTDEKNAKTEWRGTLSQIRKSVAKSGGSQRMDYDESVAF